MDSVPQDRVLDAICELPAPDGSFAPAQQHLFRTLGETRKAVVLAFPPKAGGTFLRTAIIKAIDGQLVRIVHALAGRDATPYLPTLLRYFEGGVTDKTLVTHVHMLALGANLHLMNAFAIKPVVMVRSIPDMLASYWDMIESDDDALRDGLNCHIPPNFRTLAQNAKADFIVDILAPWYVNFYAGWIAYAAAAPDKVLMIDFRVFQQNPAGVVAGILDHVGLPCDTKACEAGVAYAWEIRSALRFNKGEGGRGAAYFRPVHLKRLTRMAAHYPVLADWCDVLLSVRKRA
ncbi:sulfotransferase [Rhizomicrobium electricum]|uniref:Sulfotransferase domain-containing protein n=1 Tax=Rhizomicrobium electricum TaxID=480070 RepID=A0ABP3P0Z6_9PROT|nr:sulfotransferase [Rhizomicrobium electricum]NIJ47315.1 hypothetical protein [Rhizomicrobium electricum]